MDAIPRMYIYAAIALAGAAAMGGIAWWHTSAVSTARDEGKAQAAAECVAQANEATLKKLDEWAGKQTATVTAATEERGRTTAELDEINRRLGVLGRDLGKLKPPACRASPELVQAVNAAQRRGGAK